MRHRSQASAGFAILEILIAAVILSITAVGMALMFSTGQAYVLSEGDNRVALYLAQEQLEQFRAAGWASAPITDPSATGGPITATPENITIATGGRTYLRTWAVMCVDETNLNYNDPVSPSRLGIGGTPCPNPPAAKVIEVTVSTPSDPKAFPVTLRGVLFNKCGANDSPNEC
jgi:type II secretory pathway pseudopilin PulG